MYMKNCMQLYVASHEQLSKKTMLILSYLQPRDGPPDPKGILSITLLRSAIANANREVVKGHSGGESQGQETRPVCKVRTIML